MRPEELTELLRVRPFVPLRIHLTDGQSYEIHHPDHGLTIAGHRIRQLCFKSRASGFEFRYGVDF
jgi:hypothetical protein